MRLKENIKMSRKFMDKILGTFFELTKITLGTLNFEITPGFRF
jgi:hypothetical protein